ncbi:sulfotransferase 1B1-like [Saccoglossus kowalevskii]
MENMPLTEQRVMRSHLRPEFMPDMLFETKPKTILLTRNPKDVAVSLFNFHHNNSTLAPVEWDDFIREFCNENTEYGSYFQYVIDWDAYSDEPWVLAVRFEDIKKSPQEHIEKIADFLGKSLTNEQLKEVARVTDFQFMKSHFGYPEAWQMRQGTRLQRKGTVGDWKNVFTVSQNEAFDSIYDKKMEGYEHLKYNFLDDY